MIMQRNLEEYASGGLGFSRRRGLKMPSYVPNKGWIARVRQGKKSIGTKLFPTKKEALAWEVEKRKNLDQQTGTVTDFSTASRGRSRKTISIHMDSSRAYPRQGKAILAAPNRDHVSDSSMSDCLDDIFLGEYTTIAAVNGSSHLGQL